MTRTWKSEWPSLLPLALMAALLALAWPDAPERIPVHWDLRGAVDRYGGRVEGLLTVPLISAALYLVLLFVPNIDPAKANYERFRTAYDVIRHGAIWMMALLYALMIAVVRGATIDIPPVALTLVGVFFVAVGLVLPRLERNWFFGFRTPWTLSSDLAWARAHRVAGWTMIATGAALAAAGWIRTTAAVIAVLAVLLGGLAAATWVSYRAWREDTAKRPSP